MFLKKSVLLLVFETRLQLSFVQIHTQIERGEIARKKPLHLFGYEVTWNYNMRIEKQLKTNGDI